jgi:hypothetical protein
MGGKSGLAKPRSLKITSKWYCSGAFFEFTLYKMVNYHRFIPYSPRFFSCGDPAKSRGRVFSFSASASYQKI